MTASSARARAAARAGRPLVGSTARQIRIDRRVAEDEVVRVTLHGQDGTVLFEGNVR